MTRDRDILAALGEAAFGPRWQYQTASFLKVSDRTMRTWQHADAEIPVGVFTELHALAKLRLALLHDAIAAVATRLAA